MYLGLRWLADLAWALACIECQAGTAWLERLAEAAALIETPTHFHLRFCCAASDRSPSFAPAVQETDSRLEYLDPQALADLAWALACFECQAGAAWLERLAEAAALIARSTPTTRTHHMTGSSNSSSRNGSSSSSSYGSDRNSGSNNSHTSMPSKPTAAAGEGDELVAYRTAKPPFSLAAGVGDETLVPFRRGSPVPQSQHRLVPLGEPQGDRSTSLTQGSSRRGSRDALGTGLDGGSVSSVSMQQACVVLCRVVDAGAVLSSTQLGTVLWALQRMGYQPHSEGVIAAFEAGMAGVGQ